MHARIALFLTLATAIAVPVACFPGYQVSGTGDDGGTSANDGSSSSSGGSGGYSGASSGGGSGSGSGSGGGSGGSSGASSGGGSGSGSGGGSGGDAGGFDSSTQALVPAGQFTFTDWTGQGNTTATFTHDVLFDKYEITTKEFDDWITANPALPADGQSLDPGGPYASQMYWQAAWNTYVADLRYKDPNCYVADALEANGGESNESDTFAPTYPMYIAGSPPGADKLPINCVNFYQAVAYCFWVGKRLPTEAEFQYEVTGRGRGYTFPWGNGPQPTDCTRAIWRGSDGGTLNNYNGCQWPRPIGSAPMGPSFDGVFDMQGSVEEWIWNEANNEYPPAWPADYAGPNEDGGVDLPRTARGGSFFTEAVNMDGRLYDNMGGPDATEHADLGFRCVKSRL